MEFGTVSSWTPAESVSLHYALKTFPLRGAGHIDELADGELLNGELLPYLKLLSLLRAHFFEAVTGIDPYLFKVAAERLCNIFYSFGGNFIK